MPVELEAVVMRCTYCGAEQPVPDLVERQRLLLERQREVRLAEERRANEAREQRREAEAARDKKQNRRSRRWTWLFSLIPMLIAPTIIAITVFDAPARLGFGASGSDRLEQIQAQLQTTGCIVVSAIDSEYASGDVSKLFHVDAAQCIRAIAAGGSGHRSLALRLFGSTGTEVAKASDTTDPQLAYCAPAADMLRLEIVVGPASKGRLSHMILACPIAEDAPPPKPKPKPKR